MTDREKEAKRGALRLALGLVALLLVISVPFGLSIYGEFQSFREYARTTIDEPATPPPWTTESYDAERCVGAGLDWIAACPGTEDLCRQAMPRVIQNCLGSGDRSVWCGDHRDELLRTSFGFEECEARVASGQVPDHRFARQRCALAYRTAAEWCHAR